MLKNIAESFMGLIICGAALAAFCWPLIVLFIILHFVFKWW